jgi:hypothetical protein
MHIETILIKFKYISGRQSGRLRSSEKKLHLKLTLLFVSDKEKNLGDREINRESYIIHSGYRGPE